MAVDSVADILVEVELVLQTLQFHLTVVNLHNEEQPGMHYWDSSKYSDRGKL